MNRHQPALLGGAFIGVLSSLPLLQSANACCCLWVVVGGLLTVYLQQQNRPANVETSEAAIGGLMAGAIGAVINVGVMALMLNGAGAGAMLQQSVQSAMDQNANVPPEVRDRVVNLFSSRALPVLMAAFTIPTYAIFGMLGAFLGMAVFKKKTPPQES